MGTGGTSAGSDTPGTSAFVARWATALERSERMALVFDLPVGVSRWCNAAARRRLGEAVRLEDTVPGGDARARLRRCAASGVAWEGELCDGSRAIAVPIPDDAGGVAGLFIESRGQSADEVATISERLKASELEVQRLRAAARWRDAEHAVAIAVARGRPVTEIAALAVQEVGRVLPAIDARVRTIDGDAAPVLAALRRSDGPAVSDTPAAVALQRRAPVQRLVSEAVAVFPALRELGGVGAVLYVPIAAEDSVLGLFELHGERSFRPDEVAFVSAFAELLGAAVRRERQLDEARRHVQAMEVHAARDRQALEQADEQLLRAAKLSSIGEIAAGVIHELNQPLNVLGGYVELMREGTLAESSRSRALDVMLRAVERMSRMVDGLRTFSRSGPPARDRVDLAHVATLARDLTVGALDRRVLCASETDRLVLGDANRLEQVVVNLLANALQAGGGPVRARVYADGADVVLEVTDRGPGVPEALRARIFEPFFTTKPAAQGTGLGLAVSARIVRDHGGRIEVDDNPGGGARFRVVLPGVEPDEPPTS